MTTIGRLLGVALALTVAVSGSPPPFRPADAAALRTVRIATQSPLSARYKAPGEALMLATKLAVTDRDRDLRKHGLAVDVVAFDDRADGTVGLADAHRIASDPTILAVIGPLTSDVALRVAEVYRDAGLVMITPSSTHPALTERGYPNVFRLCGRDDVQAGVAARFIDKSLGARTVYVAHDGTLYGRGNAEQFSRAAVTRRLTVVAVAEASERNARQLAMAVQAKAPDVLYFAGAAEVAGPLFREARRIGVAAKFVGADGLDSSELLRRAGEAAEGAHYTSVAGPLAIHPQARGFAYDYERRFDKKPEPFAAQAYDATTIVLRAIASAAAPGTVPSRQAVATAVRRIRHMGLTGYIAFDERGDLRRALYLVMRVSARDPEDWDDNRELKRLGIPPPP